MKKTKSKKLKSTKVKKAPSFTFSRTTIYFALSVTALIFITNTVFSNNSKSLSDNSLNVLGQKSQGQSLEARGNKTANSRKIETQIESANAKIEIKDNKLKIKYKASDEGREDIEEEEIEISKEDIEEPDVDEPTEDGTETATEGAKKNKVKVWSHFPLSINPETYELIVTTPAGTKVVAILPEKAIQNMLSNNISTRIGIIPSGTESGELVDDTDEDIEEGTESGITTTITPILIEDSEDIVLELEDDKLVYKIKGEKKFKIMGFIPVSSPVTAVVSAEDGELIKTENSFLTNLIDLLSP